MPGLSEVTSFLIPQRLLLSTIQVLQEAGKRNSEAFVLWSGVFQGEKQFSFCSGYVPQQRGVETSQGLLVFVEGDALFVVNRALYEQGEILACQVHSHPTHAFHSETDDQFPLVTIIGGLSLVIPDFAEAGIDGIDKWAWYRLDEPDQWKPIGPETEIRLSERSVDDD